MKVSIVTVCYNSEATIRDTIESVLAQIYTDVEYIIVDGASSDRTMTIVDEYKDRIAVTVSEPDKGIYDAMNKGIALASGDVIGFLNADDFYINNKSISSIVNEFNKENVDIVYGDVVYVKPDNLNKIVRYYGANNFSPEQMSFGRYPPHPAFFVKLNCFKKYGLFKTDYLIAADIELMVRLMYKHKVSYSYVSKIITKMRIGGISTDLKYKWILNKELVRTCLENGLQTNLLKILSRYPQKIFQQLVKKPKGVH